MGTKKLSAMLASAPTAPSLSGVSMLLKNSSDKFVKIDPYILFGMILMPNGKIHSRVVTTLTRNQWLQQMEGLQSWATPQTASKGDLLIITGVTSDSNQKVVFYFPLQTYVGADSLTYVWRNRAILLLMEGEPPLWVNQL